MTTSPFPDSKYLDTLVFVRGITPSSSFKAEDIAYIPSLVVGRNDILKWIGAPFLGKLVNNRIARASIGSKYRLLLIMGTSEGDSEYEVQYFPDRHSIYSDPSNDIEYGPIKVSGGVLELKRSMKQNRGQVYINAKTSVVLRCFDYIDKKVINLKVALLSNSPAEMKEVEELYQAYLNYADDKSVLLPTEIEAKELVSSFNLCTSMAQLGFAHSVLPQVDGNPVGDAQLWGTNPPVLDELVSLHPAMHFLSPGAPHTSFVFLRSWLLQDALLAEKQRSDAGESLPDSLREFSKYYAKEAQFAEKSSILGDESWSNTPGLAQPCIAQGSDINIDGIGHGPVGLEERVRGSFLYLLGHFGTNCSSLVSHNQPPEASQPDKTHTPPAGSVQDGDFVEYLSPISAVAVPEDEYNPLRTAFRAFKSLVGDEFHSNTWSSDKGAVGSTCTFEIFKNAVLSQHDCGSGVFRGTKPLHTPLGYKTTPLSSPAQVFVVDLDHIARAVTKGRIIDKIREMGNDVSRYNHVAMNQPILQYLIGVVGCIPGYLLRKESASHTLSRVGRFVEDRSPACEGRVNESLTVQDALKRVSNPTLLSTLNRIEKEDNQLYHSRLQLTIGTKEYLDLRIFPNGVAAVNEKHLLALVQRPLDVETHLKIVGSRPDDGKCFDFVDQADLQSLEHCIHCPATPLGIAAVADAAVDGIENLSLAQPVDEEDLETIHHDITTDTFDLPLLPALHALLKLQIPEPTDPISSVDSRGATEVSDFTDLRSFFGSGVMQEFGWREAEYSNPDALRKEYFLQSSPDITSNQNAYSSGFRDFSLISPKFINSNYFDCVMRVGRQGSRDSLSVDDVFSTGSSRSETTNVLKPLLPTICPALSMTEAIIVAGEGTLGTSLRADFYRGDIQKRVDEASEFINKAIVLAGEDPKLQNLRNSADTSQSFGTDRNHPLVGRTMGSLRIAGWATTIMEHPFFSSLQLVLSGLCDMPSSMAQQFLLRHPHLCFLNGALCREVLTPTVHSSLGPMKRLHPQWIGHRMRNSSLFPARNSAKIVMFHGTSVPMAINIQKFGFGRAQCRRRDSPCYEGHCDCNMLGFGVYLGTWTKGFKYASRRSESVSDGKSGEVLQAGAIVVVEVDIGAVKLSNRIVNTFIGKCRCGCGNDYSDHWGAWYYEQGYDSLFLRDNSHGAVQEREWAVADPSRCRVIGVQKVMF